MAKNTGGGFDLPYVSMRTSLRMVSQEERMSCGAACGRQVLQDNGFFVDERTLRTAACYHDTFGIDASKLAQALTHYHSGVEYCGGSPEDDPATVFAALVGLPHPWIARLKPIAGPHFVIVDDCEEGLVKIRDPWGPNSPGPGRGIEGVLPKASFHELWTRGIHQFVFRRKG